MNHQEILLGLLPPVSYARHAVGIRRQAEIDGRVWDDIAEHATRAVNGSFPNTSGDLLADWERVLGLSGIGKSYSQRLSHVLLKINAIGGLSIPYFIQLAKSAGYTITIDEPQPFRVGQNRAGDRLAIEDVMFVWQVNVQSSTQTIWRFRAGASTAGEHLSYYADNVIENIFNDLKPAHTAVRFTYLEQ